MSAGISKMASELMLVFAVSKCQQFARTFPVRCATQLTTQLRYIHPTPSYICVPPPTMAQLLAAQQQRLCSQNRARWNAVPVQFGQCPFNAKVYDAYYPVEPPTPPMVSTISGRNDKPGFMVGSFDGSRAACATPTTRLN